MCGLAQCVVELARVIQTHTGAPSEDIERAFQTAIDTMQSRPGEPARVVVQMALNSFRRTAAPTDQPETLQ